MPRATDTILRLLHLLTSESVEPDLIPSTHAETVPGREATPVSTQGGHERERPQNANAVATEQTASRLHSFVAAWEGTPHKMGGITKDGIDCSGFVHVMYKELFDAVLPRSTAGIAGAGTRVSDSELRPRDLVLFRINESVRHVGAYLGDGQFGHASSSRGVMVSRLSDTYWRTRFWTARRIHNVDP